MLIQVITFITGLLLLYTGAEFLVDGASKLSEKFGFSPLFVGMTIVAFGTSSPELIVSIFSIYKKKSMIAIGNIIGSNICNFTMVLGFIAILKPVSTKNIFFKKDIFFIFLSSVILMLFLIDSFIGRMDGLFLFVLAIFYINYNFIFKKKNKNYIECNRDIIKKKEIINSIITQLFFIVVGILSLVVGADLLLSTAVKIMFFFGISEKCIGLTIVAIGTSIPELATSIVAIIKEEVELSIGNLIGSNIFNVFGVIGAVSIIQPIKIESGLISSGLIIDFFIMFFINAIFILLLKKSFLTRMSGTFLVSIYILYIVFLIYRS